MDSARFAELTRWFSTLLSRRTLTGALGLGTLALPGLVEARKKHRHKKHRHKKKVTFNDFGCVDVGDFCQNADQCCSGICEGKKGEKTCQAHNQSTCQAGDDSCVTFPISCTSDTGASGTCDITTGSASYCVVDSACFDCARDADCVPFCGPRAACFVCANCQETGLTACGGPDVDGCTFPP